MSGAIAAGLRVRLAKEADCEGVARLLAAAFAEFRHQYSAAAFAETTPAAMVIRDRLAEGPLWVAMARELGRCPR